MISLVFPTRKRPDNLRNLWASVTSTASQLPEAVVYIDEDDSIETAKELGFKYVQGPRHPLLSVSYNEAAKLASGNILMFAGDDILFREKDWDLKVEAEFVKVKDKILFVHGGDGVRSDDLGTHGFIHRNWLDTVGYFFPPYFVGWYVDNWITDVAKGIGRRVQLPYIIAEHMHYTCGKSAHDEVYQQADARRQQDIATWSTTAELRNQDMQKLRSFIEKYNGS